MPILIVVLAFLLYAKFGNLIPGTFGHRGYSVRQIVNHMYFTLNGVFGTPLGVSPHIYSCSYFLALSLRRPAWADCS